MAADAPSLVALGPKLQENHGLVSGHACGGELAVFVRGETGVSSVNVLWEHSDKVAQAAVFCVRFGNISGDVPKAGRGVPFVDSRRRPETAPAPRERIGVDAAAQEAFEDNLFDYAKTTVSRSSLFEVHVCVLHINNEQANNRTGNVKYFMVELMKQVSRFSCDFMGGDGTPQHKRATTSSSAPMLAMASWLCTCGGSLPL